MNIVTFSSFWGSSTGGIDVFNKGLVSALASISDGNTRICACLLARTVELEKASKELGFIFATPESTRVKNGVSDIGNWTETNFNAICYQFNLTLNFTPDVVILNDTFCYELVKHVKKRYPKALLVTLFHSSYGRSDGHKVGRADMETDRKENYQKDMMRKSDLALSVGSYSKSYLESLDTQGTPNIDVILPGLPSIQSRAKKVNHFNAMSYGRIDPVSDSIKLISLSAGAWNSARESGVIKRLKTEDVRFYAIGSNGEEGVLENAKNRVKDSSMASIRLLPFEEVESFDSSDLKNKMETCAFVILNSRYENFGLTFLETCTFGTPAIISESSGFYHDLKKILGEEDTASRVISIPTDGVARDAIQDKIRDQLIGSAQDYDGVFERAEELSSLIREKWPTWHQVAKELIDKLSSLGPELANKPTIIIDGLPSEVLENPPWGETIEDLSSWCWKTNSQYHKRLLAEFDIKEDFKYPLTSLQKKFWDQREALIEHGFKDLVISGGTSSGKTTLAEHLFGLSRPHEFVRSKILYIAPTKALAQERAKAWRKKFPSPNLKNTEHDSVIVSTGDNTASDGALVRGDFNIASTVYEKANVILSASQDLFSKLNMIVIDEFHMVEDLHRGSIIECLLAKIRLEKERRMDSEENDNHLRVIIITTENIGDALKHFLTFTDYDLSEDIEPLILSDLSRARPVTHNCIVPGRMATTNGNEFSSAIFKFKTFQKENPLIILEDEVEGYSAKFESFRSSLAYIPSGQGLDARRARKEYYKDFIEQWMHKNLYGQRLLVFMNSKFEILEVAKFIKNFVRDSFQYDLKTTEEVKSNEVGISGALNVIDEIETTDFAADLKNCAEEGVFIHNSDVPQVVRESFEEYLGESPNQNCRSEIVFATETLSYGVNLKVTDVAIFNILFPEGERIQVGQPKFLPLSRCDFANMAGRAGRLGQMNLDRKPQVYWYLDPEDERSFESMIKIFYVNPPEISSKLFHKSDARTLIDLNKVTRRSKEIGGNVYEGEDIHLTLSVEDKAIEKFSYPFSRSVLDGVRFLGGTDRQVGFFKRVGCMEDEVVTKFFFETLYHSQNCITDESTRSSKKREELESAISKVIQSATHPVYNLIRKPATGGYQITPLGCSTIDTGTEIATVTKLRSSLLALDKYWKQTSDSHLPFELAILPIFFQPEVHRQYLARLPEFRLAMDWNPAENRSDLIKRITNSLVSMQVVPAHEAIATQDILHKFMDWTTKNQPIVIVQGRYEEAPQDGCLRLFVAFLAWISGSSVRGVIGEIQKLYQGSNQTTSSSVFNFESFAENLTWKILFLISLIRASKGQILPASSTFDAVRFVLRSRFGCAESAIPLLFRNKSTVPPLNRVKVHELLNSGCSSADIALGPLDHIDKLSASEKRKIKKHVRVFIKESFHEVARQFSFLASGSSTINKSNEEASKKYWSFASEQVQMMLSGPGANKPLWQESSLDEIESLTELIKLDQKDEQILITRLEYSIEIQTFSPTFERDDSDRISVQNARKYRAYFSFGDIDDLIISEPQDNERIIIVDFPWTAGVLGGDNSYCRLSPAAFGILLSLCARRFVIDINQYLDHITSSRIHQAPINTSELYALSEAHLQDNSFPPPLFEAWAKYTEVTWSNRLEQSS